jgi:hypothetical protein
MSSEMPSAGKPHAESFCWIRILRITDDATTPKERVVVTGPEPLIKSGWRPPSAIASAAEVDRSFDKGTTSEVTTWHADADYAGRASAATVFDYGPVFDSRPEAVDWLTETDSGRQWNREALNVMLMGVRYGAGIRAAAPFCGTDKHSDTNQPPNSAYPRDAWSESACARHLFQAPLPALFDPLSVHCPDIAALGVNDDHECTLVARATAQQMAHEQVIRLQAQGAGQALLPVFAVFGIDPDQPTFASLKRLIGTVAEPTELAIFAEKRRHGRRRPWQVRPDLVKPMFSQNHALPDGRTQPHLLYPGHPSYPSGHAVIAFVWAGLLSHIAPHRSKDLNAAAQEVAFNRVRAGLHYPSDIVAGKQLATSIVRAIVFGADPAQSKETPFALQLKSLLAAYAAESEAAG